MDHPKENRPLKVLFVIHHLINGGASNALIELIQKLREEPYGISYMVCTNKNEHDEVKWLLPSIREVSGKELFEISADYDIIHWFRTNSSSFFSEFVHHYKHAEEQIPILLTHCQIPASFKIRLSLDELKYVTRFVMITKHALNHPLHNIIDKREKQLVYFGVETSFIPEAKAKPDDPYIIKLGRGSSLNKCPEDMLEVFSKLDTSRFELHIAGDGNLKHWRKQVTEMGLDGKVFFYGHLSKQKWIEFIADVDIFWYQLPANSYSAIDSTIQHGMLSGVPVVYHGPPAPAELFVHNESGMVAGNVEEFIEFTNLLAENPVKRRDVGTKGKQRIERFFSHNNTVRGYLKNYLEVMEELNRIPLPRKIPVRYKAGFFIQELREKPVDTYQELVGQSKNILYPIKVKMRSSFEH